jgi:hypothetical protein
MQYEHHVQDVAIIDSVSEVGTNKALNMCVHVIYRSIANELHKNWHKFTIISSTYNVQRPTKSSCSIISKNN